MVNFKISYTPHPEYNILFASAIDALAYGMFYNKTFLATEVCNRVGLGHHMYNNNELTKENYDKLYNRLLEIFNTHKDPVKVINDSLNTDNYIYIELLENTGQDFSWVQTDVQPENFNESLFYEELEYPDTLSPSEIDIHEKHWMSTLRNGDFTLVKANMPSLRPDFLSVAKKVYKET